MPDPRPKMPVDIVACARCGMNHPQLNFTAFVVPSTDRDGETWTYWALCPINGDPILLRVVSTTLEKATAAEESKLPAMFNHHGLKTPVAGPYVVTGCPACLSAHHVEKISWVQAEGSGSITDTLEGVCDTTGLPIVVTFVAGNNCFTVMANVG